MTGLDIFATVLGLVCTACAIVFGYIAFRRNNKCDDTAEGKKDGVLLTEIGYIKSGVDDIKRKQEIEDERHLAVVERLSAVEASAKQAHHRIDEVQSRLHGRDD